MKFKTVPLSADSSALVNIEDCELPLGGGTLTIPEKDDDGRKIVAIEKTAFTNAPLDVNTIEIPESVKSIESDAFGNNLSALHSIVVAKDNQNYVSEDGVLFGKENGKEKKTLIRYPQCKLGDKYEIPADVETVCRYAFRYCEKLTTLYVPASCVNLENWAFRNCYSIQEINVDKENPKYESKDGVLFRKVNEVFFKSIDGDFFGKVDFSDFNESPLILRNYPLGRKGEDYEVPERVVEIEDFAFNGRQLKEVKIRGSVKKIGRYAFWACRQLEKVTIEEGVERIEPCAFAWENLDRADIELPARDNYENAVKTLEVNIPKTVQSISEAMFSHCLSLTSIDIAEGIKTIERLAFIGCDGLTSVNVPGSVETIGDSSFERCNGLKKVTLAAGVKTVGSRAFAKCKNLEEVFIPETVEEISRDAFDESPNVVLKIHCENKNVHNWIYKNNWDYKWF